MLSECDACPSLLGDSNFSLSLHFCQLHCVCWTTACMQIDYTLVWLFVSCGQMYNQSEYANTTYERYREWMMWLARAIHILFKCHSTKRIGTERAHCTNLHGVSCVCFEHRVMKKSTVDNLEFLWDARFAYMYRRVRVREYFFFSFWFFHTMAACTRSYFFFSCERSRTHKQLNRNKFMRLSYSRLNLLKWNFTVAANIEPEILSSTSQPHRTKIYSLSNARRSTSSTLAKHVTSLFYTV